MARRLTRRTVLRGVGGIGVALPILECMLDSRGEALAADGGEIPCRYGLVFAGQALGGDNWAKDASRVAGMNFTEEGHFIAPPEAGTGWTMTTPLEPLALLRDDFSIVSNMKIPYNATNTDGSAVPEGGAYRDFHGGGCSPLLSGTRSTAPSFTCNGITSDQVIAQMHAGATPFGSLVYRAQPSWYLSGSSYSGRQYISYTGGGEPVEAQVSPQVAYMSLFGNFQPDNEDDIAILDFTLRSRRSVLDLITAKRERVLGEVGAADRIRLERHFDELRDLEERIAAISPEGGSCEVPPDPGTDPAIGGDNAGAGSGSIEENTGWSDETTRANVLADIIHMAFACDLTRVATLQLTVFQSHMNVFVPSSDMGIPIKADLHEVGHNGDVDNRGQICVSTMLEWHIQFYARLLQKLKDTPEGAGTLLDHSAIVFTAEAGHGRQLNDAASENQTHSVEQMVMLVGGRAGGLNPGQHIITAEAHPVQALISAMQAAGYPGDTLGEVAGTIPELFT